MSEYFRKPIVKTLMLKGQEGQSIKEIKKTGTSGLVDTYTITLTDGTTSTFTVTNGKEGDGLQNLQVGGRNLIINSKFISTSWSSANGIEIWNTNGSKFTYTTNGIRTVKNGSGQGGTAVAIMPDVAPVEYEKPVTLSFDLKVIKVDRIRFVALANSPQSQAWYAQTVPSTARGLDAVKNDPNNWHRVSCTIKIPAKNSMHDGNPQIIMRLLVGEDGGDYEYYMKNLKLERGNIPTDWTPAPEDLELESYPVGSIYTSTNSTSPAELFGGTWEQLKDRFMLAAGDTYAAGSTGGEAEHTLTSDEMPTHRHVINPLGFSQSFSTGSGYSTNVTDNYGVNSTQYTASTGGSQPHNNMPPYLAVYVWKRIA